MSAGNIQARIANSFSKERHIASLVVLRIAFGAIAFISIIRFMLKGWIAEFYVRPVYHFTFYGFDWIRPFSEMGMYLVFGVMALASVGILLGLFYRLSTITFLITFLYVELIDKTYYLNHYYFVTLVAILLILVPANRYFSIDVWRNPSIERTYVPGWTIVIFKLQFFIVYFFAGISKINHDWLLEAMPLKIWLPANEHLPLIGQLLKEEWFAYLCSWFGALFDLTIVFFLLNNKTRSIAYVFVVVFHVFTALLFKIGMFPYIMMLVTVIFFSEQFHRKVIEKLRNLFRIKRTNETDITLVLQPVQRNFILGFLTLYFAVQFTLPFRYLLYPGELFWTEEGYRFSWRVMLMEKGGAAFFYVEDPIEKRKQEVISTGILTPLQEKMIATQPDMILQYAHIIDAEYKKQGIQNPIVTVQSYVTLNGRGSRLFIDSTVDLSNEEESFAHKKWILSPNKNEVK